MELGLLVQAPATGTMAARADVLFQRLAERKHAGHSYYGSVTVYSVDGFSESFYQLRSCWTGHLKTSTNGRRSVLLTNLMPCRGEAAGSARAPRKGAERR